MAVLTKSQVVKKFLENDSPVKPGSTLIVRGMSGDNKAPASELMAVLKGTTPEKVDYAAACLGLAPGDYSNVTTVAKAA